MDQVVLYLEELAHHIKEQQQLALVLLELMEIVKEQEQQ